MKNYITTDRTNLFEPNKMIIMKFTMEGAATNDEIKKAIYAAISVNEILNMKIVLSSDGRAWYEKCSKHQNQVILSQDYWEDIVHEQQKIRFHVEEGELIRVFLLQRDDKKQILILADHLAGDGKSIVYFIEDMMRALKGEELAYKRMSSISMEMLPGMNQIPIIIRLFIKHWNAGWKRSGKVFSMNDYNNLHSSYWRDRKTVIRTEYFTCNELHHLMRQAKEGEVSLTSYIITACCEVMSGSASVGLAVDARNNHNRNMGNQTTGFRVDYHYKNNRSFLQNAKEVQARMKKKLQNNTKKFFVLYFIGALCETLVDSVYLYLGGSYQNPITVKLAKAMGCCEVKRDFSISNLTRLDIPTEYGPYKISEFIFIPPVVSYVKRLIGIATLGDEMYITYHLLRDSELDKDIEYFNKIIERLRT